LHPSTYHFRTITKWRWEGNYLSVNQPAPNFEMRWLGAIVFLERADMPVQAGRAFASPSSVRPLLFGLLPYSSADRLLGDPLTNNDASTYAHCNTQPLFSVSQIMAPAREPCLQAYATSPVSPPQTTAMHYWDAKAPASSMRPKSNKRATVRDGTRSSSA
jgi:hypothetical protein